MHRNQPCIIALREVKIALKPVNLSNSSTITTQITEILLFLSSSPPYAVTLHQNNTKLMQIIEKSNLTTPIHNSMRRGLGFAERLQANKSILNREIKELRELIIIGKERESGKRVILKAKFIVSMEEVYEKLAEGLTNEKQAKKKGKKDGVGENASTEKVEGSQLIMDEVVVVRQAL